VQCLAYSPDGRLLASAGSDHVVLLWEVATGRETAVLEGLGQTMYCLAFSPDGKLLAAGGLDETVCLWDIPDGRLRGELPGHWPVTMALSFSSDGKTLAAGVGDRFQGSASGEVKLWDVATGTWKADLLGPIERTVGWPQGSVWSLAYSPDGQLLAVGTGTGHLTLWDVAGEGALAYFEQGAGVRALAFSPDGWLLAAAGQYTVRLWDLATGAERGEIQGHRGWVWSLAFAPDGRTLATGSMDRTTRLWDVATGRPRAAYDWKIGKVHAVAFARDGMTAAAAGDAGVFVWDLDEPASLW
jgi:WD40 repeat protein